VTSQVAIDRYEEESARAKAQETSFSEAFGVYPDSRVVETKSPIEFPRTAYLLYDFGKSSNINTYLIPILALQKLNRIQTLNHSQALSKSYFSNTISPIAKLHLMKK